MGKVILQGAGRGRPGVKRGRPAYNRLFDEEKVMELIKKQVSCADIAKISNQSAQSISEYVRSVLLENRALGQYRKIRSKAFSHIQGKALQL